MGVEKSRDELQQEIAAMQARIEFLELCSQDRQKVERALQANESRFLTALKDSTITVWNQDRDLRYTWLYNPRLDYTIKDVIGKTDYDLVDDPEDAEKLMALKKRVIETGQPAREEVTLRHNGKIGHFNLAVEPTRDEKGHITGLVCSSMDITESRLTTEALRKSEQRFRATFEQAAVGIAHLDLDGKWLRVNRTLYQILGYEPSELVGYSFIDVTHPDDLAEDLENKDRLLAGDIDTYTMEKRYIRKDGSPIWVSLTGSLIRDADDTPQFFVSIVQDISKRKQIERALHEAHEQTEQERLRLEAVLEALPVGVVIADAAMRNVQINAEAERIWAGPIKQAADQQLDLYAYQGWWTESEEKIAPTEWALARAVNKGETSIGEVIDIERFDGTHGTILNSAAPVRDHDGHIIGGVVVLQDLTERRQMERALSTSEERQRLAIEAARLGTWDWTPATNDLSVGGYLFDLLGLSPNLEVDDKLLPLIYNEDRDMVEQMLAEMREEGGEFILECRILRADTGELRWLEARGQGYTDRRGKVVRASGTLQDITERKLIERERTRLLHSEQEARQAAEEANAAKTRFLGMVSHELRTPLTSIKGFASTLLAEDVQWDANSQHDFIVIISEEADKLHELVEQLLDASRLQAGKLQIEPQPGTLEDILKIAGAQLDTLTTEHELVIDLPDDLPEVYADDRRVAQVLSNLVSNAVKHSPSGSTVTISAHQEGDFVQLDVKDEGEGIPPEAQGYIFEAFRQVKEQPHSEGAGLGLAICKGFVEAHGGSVWINETTANGTTMSFTLPLARKD